MKKRSPRQGFTLIELLILVTIAGALAAILIPAFDRLREAASLSTDADKIRRIGQASLIYANDNGGDLPPIGGSGKRGLTQTGELGDPGTSTVNLHAIAAALARSGGLNDAAAWISSSDKHLTISPRGQTTILDNSTPKAMAPEFRDSGLSIAYIGGLTSDMSRGLPIAFTRGLRKNGGDGKWVAAQNIGVYGSEGGHIVFLGGNVHFYKDVGTTAETGIFTHKTTGNRTNTIQDALPSHPSGQKFYSVPNSPSGSPAGS